PFAGPMHPIAWTPERYRRHVTVTASSRGCPNPFEHCSRAAFRSLRDPVDTGGRPLYTGGSSRPRIPAHNTIEPRRFPAAAPISLGGVAMAEQTGVAQEQPVAADT